MVSREKLKPGLAKRSRSIAEKRRIVELTLREGVSLSEIARAHGVHYNSLSHWRSLYREGKLITPASQPPQGPTSVPSASLLPVAITPSLRADRALVRTSGVTRDCDRSVVQLTLPSGATLRLETGSIDADVVCALLAELRG